MHQIQILILWILKQAIENKFDSWLRLCKVDKKLRHACLQLEQGRKFLVMVKVEGLQQSMENL